MTQYYHLLSVNADSDEQQIIYWDQSDNRLKTGSYRLCCSKELWRLNFQPNHSSSTTVSLQLKEQEDKFLCVNFSTKRAPKPFFEITKVYTAYCQTAILLRALPKQFYKYSLTKLILFFTFKYFLDRLMMITLPLHTSLKLTWKVQGTRSI